MRIVQFCVIRTLYFLALLTPTVLSAQSTTIGLRAGTDMTSFRQSFSGITISTDLAPVIYVSMPVSISLGESSNFGIRLEPAYTSRTHRLTEENYEVYDEDQRDYVNVGTIKYRVAYRAAEFHLAGEYRQQFDKLVLVGYLGLTPSYLLSSSSTVKGLEDYPEEEEFYVDTDPDDEWFGLRRFELSTIVGVDAHIPLGQGRAVFGARHRLGVTDLRNVSDFEDIVSIDQIDVGSIRTRSWTFTLGYNWLLGGGE